MKKIPFYKYSSCGNNFVVVDMTETNWLSEAAMSLFAYQATNISFGVGCDNLLILQKATSETLQNIIDLRQYWRSIPDLPDDAYIFRMFEPDGQEALCCGNGLMCIAQHLYKYHGIEQAPIVTEVPFLIPKLISIGTDSETHQSWAEMGEPRPLPPVLVTPGFTRPAAPSLEKIDNLKVTIQDRMAGGFDLDISMKGYLSFTGEPHLVVFPDECFADKNLAASIFKDNTAMGDVENDRGSQLVHAIGMAINNSYHSYFPCGISVNFTRVISDNLVENRCFERGIYRETLACGTGAMAAAYAAQQLFSPHSNAITVLPHRCRWHDDEAVIEVQKHRSGWRIQSNPVLLFEGSYHMKRSLIKQADEQFNADKANDKEVSTRLTQGQTMQTASLGLQRHQA